MKLGTLMAQVLRMVGLSLVFASFSSVGLVLHLGLPAGRRTVAAALENALDRGLLGKFWIGSVERIDASGLVVRDVVVADPNGKRVLAISRLRAQADLPELLGTLLWGSDNRIVSIDHLHLARAEAYLEPDPRTEEPSLLSAFTPRKDRSSEADLSTRPLQLLVRSIEIRRGFVRGSLLGSPTLELDVSAVRGSLRASKAGAEIAVGRFGATLRGLGGTDLKGVAELRVHTPSRIRASFDGYFGDLQLGARLALDGDRLNAALEIPRARPADLRPFLPDYPLKEDARLQLTAQGILPVVSIRAEVQSGDSQLLANGPVRLGRGLRAELDLLGKNLDLRLAFPRVPKTRIDLRAHLDLDTTRSPSVLRVDVSTEPTLISDLSLPRADLSGTFSEGQLDGTGVLHEPGVPIHLRFRVGPRDTASLRLRTEQVRLEHVPRIADSTPLRGLVSARLDLLFEKGALSGEAGASLAEVSIGPARFAQGTLVSSFKGTLDSIESLPVDATFTFTDALFGEFPLTQGAARIQGPIRAPSVVLAFEGRQGPHFEAEAKVVPLAGGVRIEGLEVEVRNGEDALQGTARSLEFLQGGLDLQQLELAGLGGTVRGSGRFQPGLVQVGVNAESLDLSALGRLLNLAERPRGRINVTGDLMFGSDRERGALRLEVTDLAFGALDGLSGAAQARLEDGSLQATARGELAGVFAAEARLRGTLTAPVLKPGALGEMLGEAEISVTQLDAAVVNPWLALQGRPERIDGTLRLGAKLTREARAAWPDLSFSGSTEGLRVTRHSPSESEPIPIEGLSLDFAANVDGETGDSDLSLHLQDQKGSLLAGSLRAFLDRQQAERAPEQFVRQLLKTPLLGKIVLSDRWFSDWPEQFQPPGIRGRMRAEGTLGGTFSEPAFAARISLGDVGVRGARNQRPLDLCANLTFEPSSAELASVGEAFLTQTDRTRCGGERVLRYSVKGSINPDPTGERRPRGNLSMELEGFPLDAIPGLGDAGVSGRASGSASVADANDALLLASSLELGEVRVRGIPIGDGKLRLQSDERSFSVNVTLFRGGGHLNATAFGVLDRASPFPVPDLRQPTFMRLTARDFDAVALSPLVSDVLSELGGRVEADLSATLLKPDAEPDSELQGALQGRLSLEGGHLQLAGLGLRLSDVNLKARAEALGPETRIAVEELSGRGGRTGQRIQVREGRLELDGFRLARAEGTIDTVELPLMLEGVSQATATTRQGVSFKLRREPERMRVDFRVPYLLIALPQSSGRDLISLDENASIEVLQPLGEPTRRSGEGLPWLLAFDFGQDVRLTRADLDLPITGLTQILLADQVSVTGDLELKPGGRLQVSDRAFMIESGEVHFRGSDPSDPAIRVTATWRAADDTIVFATVVGTLKDPKLLPFTSSPSRSQEEIWALLLGRGSGEETAPGAAGAIVGAQQLLAPILQNTPVGRVTLRADEAVLGDRSYTTYSAAVPLGDKIWFEGSYHAPNATEEEGHSGAVSGTVDWRFRPHWSLRTEVGTIGTGLDLVWQYRY